MTPNQLHVLRLANELGEITRFKVSRGLGMSTDYAGYLCRGLTSEGYLVAVAARNAYSLTAKGKQVLVSELCRVAGALDKRLEWLSWQRADISRQIEKLQVEKLLKPTE